ncbi:2-oxo acid dehydrogenase subunit E2 [Agromyces aurantiacus]|uniref:Dihydrolipoamide acetyltransferase component of pyruvate dehydrogenase complex n=1 Tax=Agromyces aurantiacus TaxID=165814 RepID=A0ABV9R7Q9_9MICO
MPELRMPSLGADMERGKVIEWLVHPGDYVHRGDLVAEVDTEKTVMEIESFEEGVLAEYLVDLGETVPVGTPIARMTGTPADVAPTPSTPQTQPSPPAPVPPAPPAREVAATPGAPGAGPLARHVAHRLGVDVDRVHGTGPGGAVTPADVEAAAAAGARGRVPAEVAREAAAAAREAEIAGPTPTSRPSPPPGAPSAAGARIRSSPRARRLAAELGVDLASVAGTGPDGAVTDADVRRAAEAGGAQARAAAPTRPAEAVPEGAAAGAPTHPRRKRRPHGERPEPAATSAAPAEHGRAEPTGAAERIASLRRAVGALMARSKREIPHYYLSTTIDLDRSLEWMREANAGRPLSERLVPAALLLAASARAAKDVPEMNGFFVDGGFRPSEAVHLGVAVALRGGGLVAPAIHDADRLSPDELMAALRDLVARARAGRLRRAEMTDPTITVTNLGDLGVESVFGVIYAPQVALVGFGRVVEQPWATGGLIGVRPAVTATLSADHRVTDGLRGGRYLARVDELLQKPEEL